MSLTSMTGFSRHQSHFKGRTCIWEIKSVNGKGLEARVKVPPFLDGLDLDAKKTIAEKLTRGTVFANLTIEQQSGSDGFNVNEGRLNSLLEIAEKYSSYEGVSPPSLDGLLAINGILDMAQINFSEEELKALTFAVMNGLDSGLDRLIQARTEEGERMFTVMCAQMDQIQTLILKAESLTPDRLQAMQKRFQGQVEKLMTADKNIQDSKAFQDRMASEVAIIAVKSDIREEIDRLQSHITDGRALLDSHEPVGRRLDFLCQEMNREANTLCAKSGDTGMTRVGIGLKTIIDQFREQVQNIE